MKSLILHADKKPISNFTQKQVVSTSIKVQYFKHINAWPISEPLAVNILQELAVAKTNGSIKFRSV